MSSTIKIGILGCGRAAELIYLPALKKFSAIEVVGVVDPLKKRREILSKKFGGCYQYSSVDPIFIKQIDAAIIATPPDTHVPLASLLLKSNKYVLVEKPLALSMDETEELIQIEPSLLKLLMMGFNHRYWQPVIKLREQLSINSKINSAEITFSGDYSKWNPVSFISDPLHDLGPHVLDLIRFIFNTEIKSIIAQSQVSSKVELKVKIPGDILISTFIAHSNKTVKSIKVISDTGRYSILLGSERIHPESGSIREIIDLSDKIKRKILRRTSPIKKTYEAQLNNFFNCIRLGKPALPGFKDGMWSIAAVESARESISKNGKEIFVNEIK